MARKTRQNIKFQCDSAHDDLRKAQIHLVQLAALANERSDYINKHLPLIISYVETVITAVDRFGEGL